MRGFRQDAGVASFDVSKIKKPRLRTIEMGEVGARVPIRCIHLFCCLMVAKRPDVCQALIFLHRLLSLFTARNRQTCIETGQYVQLRDQSKMQRGK